MNTDSGNEIVVIVDENNRETGSATRREMRRQRLIHRASYIMVFNSRRELFIQKRTATKDIYPGCWDIAAGGVVLAGETYEESAGRELAEELGVKQVPLRCLFDHYHEDGRNRVWGRVFAGTHDGPFALQAEEVESGRFLAPDAVLAMSRREPFTPDGVEILQRYLQKQ